MNFTSKAINSLCSQFLVLVRSTFRIIKRSMLYCVLLVLKNLNHLQACVTQLLFIQSSSSFCPYPTPGEVVFIQYFRKKLQLYIFCYSVAQSAKLIMALVMFFSYALQMYVPMEMINRMLQKRKTQSYNNLIQVSIRTTLVTVTGK